MFSCSLDELLYRPSVDTDLILIAQEGNPHPGEAIGELRNLEAFRRLAIMVVATGAPSPTRAAECLLGGADDYCSMLPHYLPELRARLRVHLRNRRLQLALERASSELLCVDEPSEDERALAGLAARQALEEQIQERLQAGRPFAVLRPDIDHWLRIARTFGEKAGVCVQRRVTAALSRRLRPGEACGEVGERQVLVVSAVDSEHAQRLAEAQRQMVARLRLGAHGGPERITVSIGVAWFDPERPDRSALALIQRAEVALRSAKRAGRDCVVLASPAGEGVMSLIEEL